MQDYVGLQQIWLEQITPDFEMWQTAVHSKQKPTHIRTGRAIQMLERVKDPASLAEVWPPASYMSFMSTEGISVLLQG
jgi:hypothetical protein